MTRKSFNMLAAVLNNTVSDPALRRTLFRSIGEALAAQNPTFQMTKWMGACQ